jgi:hypothetical protein
VTFGRESDQNGLHARVVVRAAEDGLEGQKRSRAPGGDPELPRGWIREQLVLASWEDFSIPTNEVACVFASILRKSDDQGLLG